MFGAKSYRPQSKIDTLIGAGTSIAGDIAFSGGLRIDGEVKGDVIATPDDAASTLVISEHARVEGKICVSNLVINGTVIGPVSAKEFLELQSKAKVTGDVEYSRIEIHLGAVVQGRLIHQAITKAVELKLATSK